MNAPLPFSRRSFLEGTSSGFGYLAFSALASWAAGQTAAPGAASPLTPKQPHFAPRAKRVIFLFMPGAPSHVDTFDYKPKLTADTGKESGRGRGGPATLLGSPWKFNQSGRSGLWISELFPNVAKMADEICLIRSMHTDVPNHPPAQIAMHTGSSQFTRLHHHQSRGPGRCAQLRQRLPARDLPGHEDWLRVPRLRWRRPACFRWRTDHQQPQE